MNWARIGVVVVGLLAVDLAFAGESAGPSPLDSIDRRKIPNSLKPPSDVPDATLVQLGLRDGRWDTLAARPDGSALAASDPDGKIVLFGLPGFKTIATLNHPQVVSLCFSPDGKTLAAGDAKGNLLLWSCEAKTPKLRATLREIHSAGPLWSLAILPDGKTLASAGADGLIKLWDLTPAKPTLQSTIKAHEKVVRQLAFSHDGSLLASAGSTDHVAKLWEIDGGKAKEKATLRSTGPVSSVSFSPDDKALATASYDGKVRLWNLNRDEPAPDATIEFEPKSIRFVQFSATGDFLAALILDEQGERIAIRDRRGKKLDNWTFPHHIQSMTFIDAHHLATANEDSVYILRLSK
jgi:WD40 repeat protein